MEQLEAGAGLCRAAAFLSIRPVRAVVELGAVADVVHAALNAVHHANRHGDLDDRLAVALPGLHLCRRRARPGHEIVLFGSEAALGRYLTLDGIKVLARRGMLEPPEVMPTWVEPGEPGTAFVRDRAAARLSPGTLRRARARASRRGIALPNQIEGSPPDPATLALFYGPAVVHVRTMAATITDAPLLVSTYGFSSSQAPAVLPIRLDRLDASTGDAA